MRFGGLRPETTLIKMESRRLTRSFSFLTAALTTQCCWHPTSKCVTLRWKSSIVNPPMLWNVTVDCGYGVKFRHTFMIFLGSSPLLYAPRRNLRSSWELQHDQGKGNLCLCSGDLGLPVKLSLHLLEQLEGMFQNAGTAGKSARWAGVIPLQL